MTEPAAPWPDALRIADLFASDPHGCGGIVLRAGAGPVRDAWLAALAARLPTGAPWRRCPAGIADDRLLGGLDLAATLSAGRPVAQAGLMAEADGGVVVVPMAERLAPGTAARLAAALDTGTVGVEREGLGERRPARFGLVLLDEGAADEAAPAALAERLAFRLDLSDLRCGEVRTIMHEPGANPRSPVRERVGAATSPEEPGPSPPPSPERERGRAPSPDDEAVAALCAAADALGVASIRGPLLALRVARLAAALDGRDGLSEADAIEAARLVLAPRATRLPPPPQAEAPEPDAAQPPDAAPPAPRGDEAGPGEGGEPGLDDVVLEAARAAIPAGLLAMLGEGGVRPRGAKAGRAGAAAAANQGRPVGARAGDPRRGRLALLATLRAAAPWQAIRRAQALAEGRDPQTIIVRPGDFRITRYRQRSQSTTIFAVDASGSAALERLAEAKGAVELMLAEAYSRRDRVALVAFRGRGAELVLPPTRSLVRAKRGLADLPGGGGTPLAAGLDAAGAVALTVQRGGGTAIVVLLTDGRANVARSGEPGRAQAGADALAAARRFREGGVRAILIDTAARPQDSARALADAMGARYLPLPQADAGRLSGAVRAMSA